MSVFPMCAAVLVCGLGSPAHAEKKSQPQAQQFQEVERGLWLRATMGAVMTVTNAFGEGRESALWPPGPMIEIEAGYDFGQYASIYLGVLAEQLVGSRDMGSRSPVSNDAGALALMAGGRFNALTTKRLAWFLMAGVGWMFTQPSLAQYDGGVLIQAGTGIEYATNLRHFFVGLELFGQYDVMNGGAGVGLSPCLKYTF
ncbi:MAG: adventurous gliding motility protein CglE [Deltaproteobacteria bacterium]|nr:adventurous gliding motility protein CglE [Deltaproteobacteria bacterium]